jgi:hypothetical protein
LDDQWVAIIVRKMSMQEILQYLPVVPTGFLAILVSFGRWFDDPEWPLQVFPTLCGVAQIPLLGVLVARLTGRGSLGFVAACLSVVSPGLVYHGIRPQALRQRRARYGWSPLLGIAVDCG